MKKLLIGGGMVVGVTAAIVAGLLENTAPERAAETPDTPSVQATRSIVARASDEELEAVEAQLTQVARASREVAESVDARLSELEARTNQAVDTQQALLMALRAVERSLQDLQDGEHEASSADASPEAGVDPVATDRALATRVEALQMQLLREDPDPRWQRDAETSLAAAYGELESDRVELLGAQCRATFCRVEARLDPSASNREVLADLSSTSPWQGEGFVAIPPEGGSAILYLAREGYSLPSVSMR